MCQQRERTSWRGIFIYYEAVSSFSNNICFSTRLAALRRACASLLRFVREVPGRDTVRVSQFLFAADSDLATTSWSGIRSDVFFFNVRFFVVVLFFVSVLSAPFLHSILPCVLLLIPPSMSGVDSVDSFHWSSLTLRFESAKRPRLLRVNKPTRVTTCQRFALFMERLVGSAI